MLLSMTTACLVKADPPEIVEPASSDTGELADTGTSGTSYPMWEYFPVDGKRSWEYASDDEDATYDLEIERHDAEGPEGLDVYRFELREEESGDNLADVYWSSTSSFGIYVHGFTHPLAKGSETLDEPITIATPYMSVGDQLVSGEGLGQITSTLVGVEPCNNHWVAEGWDSCLHLDVDDGGLGLAFAGDFWLVPRYGIALWSPSNTESTWVLKQASWEAE